MSSSTFNNMFLSTDDEGHWDHNSAFSTRPWLSTSFVSPGKHHTEQRFLQFLPPSSESHTVALKMRFHACQRVLLWLFSKMQGKKLKQIMHLWDRRCWQTCLKIQFKRKQICYVSTQHWLIPFVRCLLLWVSVKLLYWSDYKTFLLKDF